MIWYAVSFFVALVAVAGANDGSAHTPDVEREARWRAEVAPSLVVGKAVDIDLPGARPFLGLLTEAGSAGKGSSTLIVLVHGIGVHPDHGIIGRLRMDLADRGFSTLSIQMPVLASDMPAEHYEPLFVNAAERIAAAAAWARAHSYRDLVLVSHSLGSRMANVYLDRHRPAAFREWVALGLGASFTEPLAAKPPLPVLDVYGERDLEAVVKHAAARARVAQASGGRQQRIADADHFYAGRESELVDLIADFARHK